MIPLLIYFINALRIPLAFSTIATIVTCASEPITAHHSTCALGLNDMDKISYLNIHARYLDIDMIQYDYGFGENQAFFRKIKRLF